MSAPPTLGRTALAGIKLRLNSPERSDREGARAVPNADIFGQEIAAVIRR